MEKIITEIVNNTKKLTPSELSYYIVLLTAALQKEVETEQTIGLLKKINTFTLTLQSFYQAPSDNTLEKVTADLDALITEAKFDTFSMKIKAICIRVCSIFTASIAGIIGAALGLGMGCFSLELNFLNGAKSGFITGLALGLLVGVRAPDWLFRSHLESKLLLCFTQLKKINGEFKTRYLEQKTSTNNPYAEKRYDHYQNETKKYIIDTFYNDATDKEQLFKTFLASEQSFQVCAVNAHLIHPSLDGTLGHHALIRYKINGKISTPIEYGERTKNPRWIHQTETPRTVTGQTLFEMLTLDRILQETHRLSIQFSVFTFHAGENDCHTYVDKILIGTHQKPTVVQRFLDETDTLAGKVIVKNCVTFLKHTSHGEIQSLSSHFDGILPVLSIFAKPHNKELKQAVPGWAGDEDTHVQGPMVIKGL